MPHFESSMKNFFQMKIALLPFGNSILIIFFSTVIRLIFALEGKRVLFICLNADPILYALTFNMYAGFV